MLLYKPDGSFLFPKKRLPAKPVLRGQSDTLMEPKAGIEPATYSLRVNCSTPEPLWRAIKIYPFGR